MTRDVFRFNRGRQEGTLTQTHLRFRFDFPEIRQHLVGVFTRLFALRGNNRDAFEVVVTFNAVLHSQDTQTFSLFYGTDHRENNRMGAARELSYGNTFVVRDLSDVTAVLPHQFNAENLIETHLRAFPNSNVRVHTILNVIYLIYQLRN